MTAPLLVDSHCHLDFPEFDGQVDDIVSRAVDNGVGVMQTICTQISKFPQVLAIAEQYDNVYASVGIHPHNADSENTTVEELVNLTAIKITASINVNAIIICLALIHSHGLLMGLLKLLCTPLRELCTSAQRNQKQKN